MKIGGPKGPTGPKPPKPPADTSAAGGARFADVLSPQGATPPNAAGTVLAELAARVQSGDLTANEAAQRVIDAVVEHRGGALSAVARDALRTSLQRLLDDDPTLMAKLQRLGDGGDDGVAK